MAGFLWECKPNGACRVFVAMRQCQKKLGRPRTPRSWLCQSAGVAPLREEPGHLTVLEDGEVPGESERLASREVDCAKRVGGGPNPIRLFSSFRRIQRCSWSCAFCPG